MGQQSSADLCGKAAHTGATVNCSLTHADLAFHSGDWPHEAQLNAGDHRSDVICWTN